MTKLAIDDATLLDRMRKAGITCDRIAEGTIKGRFRAKGRTFPLNAHLEQNGYLTLAVVPYLRSPASEVACEQLYLQLLVLNHKMLLAKFAVDDDLDVFLCTEFPTADLDESELRDAVDVLGVYAVEHYDALAAIAAV